jgi:cyclopropane-fatty-acyl-phospholipid synthase
MGLIQAIVIADQKFEDYRRSVDFIQRHIFPGGLIPSVAAITERLARVTDLRLTDLEDLTPHYARTLRLWRERFMANRPLVTELGLPESFQRLWEFYFCYCEGGFLERTIGSCQLLLAKPLNRREPIGSEV